MKKRKSPFGMIAILAIVVVAIIMVNAKSHASDAGPSPDQPAQAQPDDSKQAAAPNAADLSKQLASQVKDHKVTPKKAPSLGRPALENPQADNASVNPKLKQKIDPESGVQGGWYSKDSGLDKAAKK
ncbi:MAG TPA: hypothetical protein VGL56_01825 [Fimbriimonadaceae bacterium]|jgi:hypothetical protein